ncbi:MAG: metal ABC transporter substrate-binding protein [Bacillota bacterium]
MRVAFLFLAAVIIFSLGGCGFGNLVTGYSGDSKEVQRRVLSDQDGKLKVVTTFFPLYDFARQVGGERVEVLCLVPPGVSVHDWEPTPRTMAQVLRADVLVFNGAGLEPWIKQAISDFKGETVEASRGLALLRFDPAVEDEADGEHHHGVYDPHAWLDPVNAQHYVKEITKGFCRADPAGAGYYREREAAYIERLKALDAAYREAAAGFKCREIVTSHAAFGYLANRYGLKQIPVAGLSPQAEPSPAQLRNLVELVRKHGIDCIFFEEASSPRLAETLAREARVKTLVLSPVAGMTPGEKAGKKDYLAVMQDNLATLTEAFGEGYKPSKP